MCLMMGKIELNGQLWELNDVDQEIRFFHYDFN